MAKISIPDLNPAIPYLRHLSEGELKITGGSKDENDGGCSRLRHVYDDKKGKKNKD
ncbi:MAG: hypothetical protein ACRC2R_09990 [Xenococcaceae cyanobacterium]